MKPPPVTVSPEEAVPSPTVPEDVRKPLLRLASDGVTTANAAVQLSLTEREVWRFLELLRVAGDVHLRATEDGRGAEWCRTRTKRNS